MITVKESITTAGFCILLTRTRSCRNG